MSAESTESGRGKPRNMSHHICFRVGGEVKDIWDMLSKSDRLALTRFFRDAIVSYSSMRSIISFGLRDVAELTSVLRTGYESCKDALKRCEERCRDVEEVRAEYRGKVEEYEKRIAEYEDVIKRMKVALAEKENEIARLKSRLTNMMPLSKLKLLVCSLLNSDKTLAEELNRYGLTDICKDI
jgi:uncharacterized coiled-coil protein SlyX